jgi:GNAT superfamily N-acetyltransferase
MATDDILDLVERYYDEVPRASATTEDIGPFTLFLRTATDGWHFYARPRLGHQGRVTADDVRQVLDRQHELDVPRAFEWMHDRTAELAEVLRALGLEVQSHPLMVRGASVPAAEPAGVRIEAMAADHPGLEAALAAVSAAFRDTDELAPPRSPGHRRSLLADGRMRMVGGFDALGPVGGGSHSPRGTVTELTGIAVLPRARRRGVGAAITAALAEDAREHGVRTVFLSAGSRRVADLYARVGFVHVGTACEAEA